MRQRFTLVHDMARHRAAEAVLNAPAGYVVLIGPEKRTEAQNRKFHKLCDISSKAMTFRGRVLEMLQWKHLYVSGHCLATNREADLLEGIEGEILNIRESTAEMDKARKSSLIEYVVAYMAGEGCE